jgi:[ribosomal protein S18]-alanine N-acetyltransferase
VDFTLRDFQSNDLEVLWRIDQECFPPGIAYSKAELSAYIDSPAAFAIVAEVASKELKTSQPIHGTEPALSSPIAGFIVAEANRRGLGQIITIDVLPEGRRSGIGFALLTAAEERLRRAQCERVRLEAAVDNVVALSFYKRHGYAVVKTIRGYYSDGGDAYLLAKAL